MKNQNITFNSAYETPLSFEFSKAYSSFPLEIESKLCIAHLSCGTKVPQTNIIHKAREHNTSQSLTVPSLHKRVLHNEKLKDLQYSGHIILAPCFIPTTNNNDHRSTNIHGKR